MLLGCASGDSGTPLLLSNVDESDDPQHDLVIGVTSAGCDCLNGNDDSLAVFTNVNSFRSWIAQETGMGSNSRICPAQEPQVGQK